VQTGVFMEGPRAREKWTMSAEMQSSAEYSTRISNDEITVTPAAGVQLAALLSQSEDQVEGVRVFVSGGGCGGMSYGMTYADRITPYDKILEGDGFRLVVDAVALNYLQGCQIDFVEQGMGANFVFNNVFQAVGGSGVCGACGAAGGGCA